MADFELSPLVAFTFYPGKAAAIVVVVDVDYRADNVVVAARAQVAFGACPSQGNFVEGTVSVALPSTTIDAHVLGVHHCEDDATAVHGYTYKLELTLSDLKLLDGALVASGDAQVYGMVEGAGAEKSVTWAVSARGEIEFAAGAANSILPPALSKLEVAASFELEYGLPPSLNFSTAAALLGQSPDARRTTPDALGNGNAPPLSVFVEVRFAMHAGHDAASGKPVFDISAYANVSYISGSDSVRRCRLTSG